MVPKKQREIIRRVTLQYFRHRNDKYYVEIPASMTNGLCWAIRQVVESISGDEEDTESLSYRVCTLLNINTTRKMWRTPADAANRMAAIITHLIQVRLNHLLSQIQTLAYGTKKNRDDARRFRRELNRLDRSGPRLAYLLEKIRGDESLKEIFSARR